MPPADDQPVEPLRPDAGSATGNDNGNDANGLRKKVSGDGGRSVRKGGSRVAVPVQKVGGKDEAARPVSRRRKRTPGGGRSDGGFVRAISSPGSDFGFRFDRPVARTGYTWWYVDAVSDDGKNAIVLILFVGSVFSPYYAWKGWDDPEDHCALNVALYGKPSRWAMTERGRKSQSRGRYRYRVGRSLITSKGHQLIFDIHERGMPFPNEVVGHVTVTMPYCNEASFELTQSGKHIWRPICLSAEVSVEFSKPKLSWSGHGYVDMNTGDEPLEKGFSYWDWSRIPMADGSTQIRYVTDPRGEERRELGLEFAPDGAHKTLQLDDALDLPQTPIWRIPRRAGKVNGAAPQIVKTLEDTPFYSRSLVSYPELGGRTAMHESVSGDRLSNGVVKCLLPFRMPRHP